MMMKKRQWRDQWHHRGVQWLGLLLLLALGGCIEMPQERVVVQETTAGNSEAGRLALASYGCNACHHIPGVSGPTAYVAPPLDALPPAMAELVSVVATTVEEMGMGAGQADDVRPSLTGLGIGTLPFTGRAVVATSAEQALERLQPGDVLVTLTTSPAYNLVLSMVGGLVTAEGGPVCHAAVLSRELGLPAVIGVRDALTSIPDGAIVELDPSAGLVRVHGTD